MKELKKLNALFVQYKWQLIAGIAVTIVARIFSLVLPYYVGELTNILNALNENSIGQDEATNKLVNYILIIVGATLIGAGLTFVMRQLIIVVSRHLEYDLKNLIYQQYQRLSLGFYKQNRTGDLMNRVSEDVSKVRMYMGPAIMYSLNMVTLFAVIIPTMFYIAPTLAFYTLLPLPILSIAIYKVSREIHKRSTLVQQYLSNLNTIAQETFSGISVIKAYNLNENMSAQFTQVANDSKEKNVDLARVQAIFFPMMVLLIGLSNLMVIYIGGKQYIDGTIEEIGTISSFLIYVNMLTWPVAIVGWVTNMIQQAEASQKRINEFLDIQPAIQNEATTTTAITGKIAFKKVNFIYEDTNIQALKNVSFEIDAGKTLAILGKTGSGKSTILELIGRLYDINDGTITIDDKAIRALDLDALRQHIGYVPQDAFLFSDTIGNNIAFGKVDATGEEIEQAARNAVVHKNIKNFSKRYDTVLGERGITLSGGQKQRVSIARAIIKKPSILLFDDCLSAVDTETEEKILNNLKRITQDTTTIIVSHRVSSAKNADLILIMDNGAIVERGTHDSLLNTGGYYSELYANQMLEE